MPTKKELEKRIAELESCLRFYADSSNYMAEPGKRSRIAGDAWGAFARVTLNLPDDFAQ